MKFFKNYLQRRGRQQWRTDFPEYTGLYDFNTKLNKI